ncbi:MAG: patatin-like phospholipase family protein [Chrysiogenetes bacterium]|nr:patatin-like phospholipase family protein [Chrysiogenetes bacterium]
MQNPNGGNGAGLPAANEEPEKLAVCLCGGGLTGAFYEVGVLRALDEYLGPGSVRSLFDVWVGTSAGASVAGFLSQGVSPERLFQAMNNLDDPFFPFRRADVFRPDLKRWGVAAMKAAGYYFFGVLANALRMPGTPPIDWGRMVERQLPGGMFSLDAYRASYEKSLKRNGLAQSFLDLGRDLVIPALELETGERWAFAKGGELETTPIALAVAASSAIPGFFDPVRIRDRNFIDGGSGQVAHVDLAVERGAKSIVVINPMVPVQLNRPHQTLMDSTEQIDSIAGRGPIKVWAQALRISTANKLRMALKRYTVERPDLKVFLIEPPLDDATMFLFSNMDESSRHTVLAHGYNTTRRALEETGEGLRQLVAGARHRWEPKKGPSGPPGPKEGEFHILCGEDECPPEGPPLVGTGW